MRLHIYVTAAATAFTFVCASSTIQAQEKLSTELKSTTAIFPSLSELEQVNAQGRAHLTIDVENDSLLLKRDDGFYTSGNHFMVEKTLRAADYAVTYGWHVGQDLYTASDIKIKPHQLNPIDHPYAGWLYAGVYREVQQNDGSGFRLGLDIGCLGPCAGGEWTQTHLHQLLNQPLPQAWSTQLKQEWGAVANAEIAPARWQLNSDTDIGARFKLRLGNIFTDAKAELVWRYGRLNVVRDEPASFVFARVEARAIAYNATLQGGYFNEQMLAVHPKRVVPEVEFGYQYRGDVWGFYASVLRRGTEIKELSNAKAAQNFAKLQLIYAM
ncbi:lipid A-modifier LpxR family protein [Undibacterium flavidum]|uniref:Lipid A deacylase LpxR family protein n=1 Tax=Undibacterium flavidum TaxID=2762297 RepID=A0ABR6Y6E0_9BURK|nr:lipid A-modifier LpxR family protein [Undibacterium flavidum]MBC3872179.1 lipid A deacylase LpxR family protein [Undibacterium flavidum]